MVVHCAAREWDKASAEPERFLARDPGTPRVHEALDDLADLEKALSIDLDQIQPPRQRWESLAQQEVRGSS